MSATARTRWLAGLVLGVLDGFLGSEFPTLALVLLVAAILALGRAGDAFAGLGGLLLGGGVVWLVVLVRAVVDCRAFDAAPNQECVMPDITPYVVAAAVAALGGIGLSLVAAIRRR